MSIEDEFNKEITNLKQLDIEQIAIIERNNTKVTFYI